MNMPEDLYEILQVHPSAESEVIEAAYKKLAQKYHPDVDKSPKATERMKMINVAHDVLSDPEQRRTYNATRLDKKGGPSVKPNPIVDPPQILFKNVTPGTVKTASFLVINTGGPYSKISISNPDTWLKIVDWRSISITDELPLRVNLQVQGNDWYKTYLERVYISLDDIRTFVTVTLQTRFRMVLQDYNWRSIEFDDLKEWAKGKKDLLDAGQELIGKTFRYRYNKSLGKYQVRLRHNHSSGIYDPYH